MKFIVKRDFYRTKQLKDVKIVGGCKGALIISPHENHIQIGAFVEIGDAKTEIELQRDDKAQLIAQLRYAGCIGNAADEEVVKRVENDIATATKREKTASVLDKKAAGEQLVEALTVAAETAAK